MASIVTYQHAYVGGTTSLCEAHAAAPPSWLPKLGPVSHGSHEGTCAACRLIAGYDAEDAEVTSRDTRREPYGA